MKVNFLLLLLIFTLIFTAGCSSTYTCQDYPTGGCRTVTEVYKSSNNPLSVEGEGNRVNTVNVKSVDSAVANPLPKAESETPLLESPQVLRIFVNHWEDDEGDLHVGGYMYIRIKDSAWNI